MGAEQLANTRYSSLEQGDNQFESGVISFEDSIFEAQQQQLLAAEKVLEEKNKQPGERLRLPVEQYQEVFLHSETLLELGEVVAQEEGMLELLFSDEALAELDPHLADVFGDLTVEAHVRLQQDEEGQYVLQEVNLLVDWVHEISDFSSDEEESLEKVSSSEKAVWKETFTVRTNESGEVEIVGVENGILAARPSDTEHAQALIDRKVEIILQVVASGEPFETYSVYRQADGTFLLSTTIYALEDDGNVSVTTLEAETVSGDQAAELAESGVLQGAFDENGLPIELRIEETSSDDEPTSSDDTDAWVPVREHTPNATVGEREQKESTVDTGGTFEVITKTNEGRGFKAEHMRVFTVNREIAPSSPLEGGERLSEVVAKKPMLVAQSLVTNTKKETIPAGGFQLRVAQKAQVKTEDGAEKPVMKEAVDPEVVEVQPQRNPELLAITYNTEEVAPNQTALLYVELAENVWQQVASEEEAEEVVLSLMVGRVETEGEHGVQETIAESTHTVALPEETPDAPTDNLALPLAKSTSEVVSHMVVGREDQTEERGETPAEMSFPVEHTQLQETGSVLEKQDEEEQVHASSGQSAALEQISVPTRMRVGEEMTFSYQSYGLKHKQQEAVHRGGSRSGSGTATVTQTDSQSTAPVQPSVHTQPSVAQTATASDDVSPAATNVNENRTKKNRILQEEAQALSREVEEDVHRIPPGLRIHGLSQLPIPDQTTAMEKIRSLSEDRPDALPGEARIEREGSEYRILFDGERYALAA